MVHGERHDLLVASRFNFASLFLATNWLDTHEGIDGARKRQLKGFHPRRPLNGGDTPLWPTLTSSRKYDCFALGAPKAMNRMKVDLIQMGRTNNYTLHS